MDVSAKEIVFGSDFSYLQDPHASTFFIPHDLNVCNFCSKAEVMWREVNSISQKAEGMMFVEAMKIDGRGKKYDCLIGLSGGVDSAWALHTAKSLGLRPLAFSVDNGWNDDKADQNVYNLVERLKVPFEKVVIDWGKFREIQAAFMKAGQINIEIPTDHILMAVSLEMASRHGITYILSGGNVATESIMPESWGYNARDLVHIEAIYEKFYGTKLRDLPTCSLLRWNWYRWIKRIRTVYLLDYYNYDRRLAKDILMKQYGYQDVGEKHEESIFTRWFQNFYLFEKFGIDKRKAHYSSMIVSGQMTREEAMEKLDSAPVYPELGLERKVLKYPIKPYTAFPTDERLHSLIAKYVRIITNLCKS